MSNKIGRNAKCPCGSNLKYKHCCLKKGINYEKNNNSKSHKNENPLRNHFKEYHNIDLVATLAALSVNPLNHGKNLRLEYLLWEALSTKSSSEKLVDPPKLSKFLNQNLGHHHLEDPPGNLFTENIIYTLGNNTVYGGNFEQGAFIMNTITSAIQFSRDKFPNGFLDITNDAFLLLLTMSDMVAKMLGHNRNLLGEHENSESELIFPTNLDEIKNALFFTNDWIESFTSRFKINKSIVSQFSIDESDKNNFNNDIADALNPIIRKPLAQLTNGVLLASPTNVISALIHFSWVQSEKHNCLKVLINEFHKTVWKELLFYTNKVKFNGVDFDFDKNDSIPIKNALFRIDTDKLVFLSFIFDEGEKYNHKTPCHQDPMLKMEEAQKIQQKNYDLIKTKFPNCKIIDLTLYSTIGREYMLMFPRRDEYCHTLITSAFKFLCWIKSDSHDKMSLWYFLEAKKRFESGLQFRMPSDFLDYFNLYKKDKSFYLGDKSKPNGFVLLDGGLNIIKDAADNEDKIVVYHRVENIKHPVLIPVIKFGDYVPRYFNSDSVGGNLEFYIPGYDIDLWLKAKNEYVVIPKENFHLYWEFSEAIAYWFWQIKEQLNPHLAPLKKLTFLFSFDFLNIELFENPETFGKKSESFVDKFSCKIEANKIKLNIPGEISGHISSHDNEGERIILKQILCCFGKLLEANEIENTLSKEVIDDIVDERIPLGLKKMLLFINTKFSLALDPRNVNPARYIQEARKQWYMDEVIPLLKDKCPPEGEIEEKSKKQNLAKNIVFGLLGKLKEILKEYDSTELLFKLMQNYESILHENALSRLRTPPRLHCFSEEEDIVQEIQKKTEIKDETSLVLRCLIEHLAAEPSFGTKLINQQLVDDLIALMSLIIWWGGIGDRIRYDLFDIELSILPSLRVGTNSREISERFFQQFSKARTREYIDDTVDDFTSFFVEKDSKKKSIPEGFDKAFINQVGISFAKLGGIVHLMTEISFEQKSEVSSLEIPELKNEIRKSFEEDFSDEEINSAISFLSLWNRGTVNNVPDGFTNIDISPWRYNRKLSYLQRPLIMIDYGVNKENPKIYWTPRSLDQSWSYINYLFLSGRYRAEEKSDLERQISIIAKKRGAVVQKEVISWFKSNTDCFIDEEVEISPKGKLKHVDNIGDSDVFVVDHNKKHIYSIECKRTEQAKNSKEMIEQVDQYYGSGSKKGYLKKHLRRHSWLTSNKKQIGEVYDFNANDYTVFSFFITYEILAIQFMKNKPLPIPMYSLFDFKKMSYEDLIDSLSTNLISK